MYDTVILPLSILIIVGSIGIFVISRKRPEEAGKLWLKYFVFLALMILHLVTIVFGNQYYVALMAVVVVAGLYEILMITRKYLLVKVFSIIIFLIISFLMFWFILTVPNHYILFFFISTLIMDAFSQIFGQLTGKHHITQISPNKTYEGMIGGVLMCIIGGYYMKVLIGSPELIKIIAISISIGILAFLGDLLASYLKRKVGVKDFSALLPGQGGVLDRYDSWMIAGVTYFILNEILFIL